MAEAVQGASRGRHGMLRVLFLYVWVYWVEKYTDLIIADFQHVGDIKFVGAVHIVRICHVSTVQIDIAKGVKSPKRKNAYLKEHLRENQIHDLLKHYEGNLRDFAIVNLLLRTGLRTIEVVRANVEDITFKGGQRILRVWGKGRDDKDTFVVLTDKAYAPIRAYLDTRKSATLKEPLFISTSNRNLCGRLTTRTISKICKEGLCAIGLDAHEYTAHSLRHTTAVMLLKHGTLSDVQSVLRHASPVTSQIYTKSIEEELRLANPLEMKLDGIF